MQPTSKHIARLPACGKKNGAWSADRANQRRHEYEAARSHRRPWAPDPVFHDGRPDQRLRMRRGHFEQPAFSRRRLDWPLVHIMRQFMGDHEAAPSGPDEGTNPFISGLKSQTMVIRHDKRPRPTLHNLEIPSPQRQLTLQLRELNRRRAAHTIGVIGQRAGAPSVQDVLACRPCRLSDGELRSL